MADKVWVGGTDTDFDVAANWDPSGVPATGDALIYNEQAQNNCTDNVTQAAKTFKLYVEEGFTKTLGATGLPLKPDAFDLCYIRGNSQGIFLQAGSGTIDFLDVDTASNKDDMVQVMGGNLDRLTVRNGRVKLNATTITGRLNLLGTSGEQGLLGTRVNIPAGNTLTGLEIAVEGGELNLESDGVTVLASGGLIILGGSAGVTGLLELTGSARCQWDATSSTIALLEARGQSIFRTRVSRTGRTMTEAHTYDDAVYDARIGGLLITHTAGVRVHGKNPPLMPMGCQYSFAA